MSCILFRISALSMKENYIARDYNILHTYTVPHTPTAAALEVLALSAQISLRCDFKCVFFFPPLLLLLLAAAARRAATVEALRAHRRTAESAVGGLCARHHKTVRRSIQ
jgi:hypothetical protein